MSEIIFEDSPQAKRRTYTSMFKCDKCGREVFQVYPDFRIGHMVWQPASIGTPQDRFFGEIFPRDHALATLASAGAVIYVRFLDNMVEVPLSIPAQVIEFGTRVIRCESCQTRYELWEAYQSQAKRNRLVVGLKEFMAKQNKERILNDLTPQPPEPLDPVPLFGKAGLAKMRRVRTAILHSVGQNP